MEQDGIQIHYLFYSEKGPKDEGVVLKVINTSSTRISYKFVIIFKSEGRKEERLVSGVVDPKSFKTGESEGLYWTPFGKGISIGEIGIRGLKIRK